jgi:hypothetical protein
VNHSESQLIQGFKNILDFYIFGPEHQLTLYAVGWTLEFLILSSKLLSRIA